MDDEIVGWHYSAKKVVDEHGDVSYVAVETFPGLGSTLNGVTFEAESVNSLAQYLELAAEDIRNYPVVESEQEEDAYDSE